MLIEFIAKNRKKKQFVHILGMGISNTENNNKNDFYSYLQKNYLTYINYINQTPKGAQHKEIRDNY